MQPCEHPPHVRRRGDFIIGIACPLPDPVFRNAEFRKPSSPSKCSGSGRDRFRRAAPDSCHTKLKWSGGPWSMPLVKVGARTTPVSWNPELVRPETLEPYPDPELSPDLVSSFLHGFWSYPVLGTGPPSSPEQVTSFFRIKPTQCYFDESGKNMSVPDYRISINPDFVGLEVPPGWLGPTSA